MGQRCRGRSLTLAVLIGLDPYGSGSSYAPMSTLPSATRSFQSRSKFNVAARPQAAMGRNVQQSHHGCGACIVSCAHARVAGLAPKINWR